MAKALTSGYFPIGAAIVSGRIASAFEGDTAFQHLFTFGGNPAASAAALANLDIMEREGFAARSAEMGAYLFERLQTLKSHAIVGDVRGGKGLLAALELVQDRATKAQFPKDAKLDQLAVEAMRAERMLGRAGHVIPLAPPLCITTEEVDEAVARLDRVLARLGGQLGVG